MKLAIGKSYAALEVWLKENKMTDKFCMAVEVFNTNHKLMSIGIPIDDTDQYKLWDAWLNTFKLKYQLLL